MPAKRVEAPPEKVTKEQYAEWKNRVPETPEEHALKAFIGYGCSYSGKFFCGFLDVNHKRGDDYQANARNSSLKKLAKLDGVEFLNLDYRDVILLPGDVAYCDIPYRNTTQYKAVGAFDHEAFYGWAKAQDCLVLVSEYAQNVPEGAQVVWSTDSNQSMQSGGQKPTTEVLFTFQEIPS